MYPTTECSGGKGLSRGPYYVKMFHLSSFTLRCNWHRMPAILLQRLTISIPQPAMRLRWGHGLVLSNPRNQLRSIPKRDVLKRPDDLGHHNAVSFFFKTSFGACSARLDTKTFASHSLHCPSCSIRSDCTPELIRMRVVKNLSAALCAGTRVVQGQSPRTSQDAAKASLRRDDQTLPTRPNPCTHHRRTWTGLRPSYLQLIATGYSPCSNLQSQLQDRGMSLCTVPKGGCRAMRHSLQLCLHEQSFGLEYF